MAILRLSEWQLEQLQALGGFFRKWLAEGGDGDEGDCNEGEDGTSVHMWRNPAARSQLLEPRAISQREWTELKEGHAEKRRKTLLEEQQ